jgi:hypothetical protein
MSKLPKLVHLSLKFTDIQTDTMISVVCKIPSLQHLELDGMRKLDALPSQISQLTSLQYLSLSDSKKITFLPTEIGSLTDLHTLDLYDCISLSMCWNAVFVSSLQSASK